MISFVIPAHNEEVALPQTIDAIHASARPAGQPYEIIVVDDASTDATAEVARRHGARVVPVQLRQIAATRNAGGRAALGHRLFFIDADATINPRVVAGAMRRMDQGAVGGGAGVKFEGDLPLYARLLNPFVGPFGALTGFVGGACMFCSRQAFLDSGGFNEKLFCGEECFFILALQRLGRFDVLWARALTSGRRFRTLSGLQVLLTLARISCSPLKSLTHRKTVEKVWYHSNRQNDETLPNSISVRISNAIALAVVLLYLTSPLRMILPWQWTPMGTVLGDIRFLTGLPIIATQCLLSWACALALTISLLADLAHRRWWTKWSKTILATALCWWLAWDAAQSIAWLWTNFPLCLHELRLQ